MFIKIKSETNSYDEYFIKKSKHSDNTKRDIITELSVFLAWACEQSLIKAKPQLPKKPKIKTLKSDRIYSLSERNLVIRNIKNRKMQITVRVSQVLDNMPVWISLMLS